MLLEQLLQIVDLDIVYRRASIHQKNDVVVRAGNPVRSWMGVADGLLKISNAFRSSKYLGPVDAHGNAADLASGSMP